METGPDPNTLLKIALRHHHAGELVSAETLYRKILAIAPDHADSLHLLGVIAFQSAKYNTAEELLRKAIDANHREPKYYSTLARVLQSRGKLDESISLYEQSLALDSSVAQIHCNYATALQANRRFEEAGSACERALALKPDFAEAAVHLGTVRLLQGRLAEAGHSYRHALLIDPSLVDASARLGDLLQAQGKTEEAASCYQEALTLRPESHELHCRLGNIRRAQGRLEDAAALYARAIELKPDLFDGHESLGKVRHLQGRFEDAAGCFGHALALRPGHPGALCNLGTALQSQGRQQEAVAKFQQAIERNPNFAEAHYNMGNALKEMGEVDRAAESYQKALSLRPDYAEVYNNLGTLRHATGQLEEAAHCFRLALGIRPKYAGAHYNLGCALRDLGDRQGALDQYRIALEHQANRGQVTFSLSLIQLQQGDLETGWKNYEERWNSTDHNTPRRHYTHPLWNGERLSSGSVLLWGEQGIGDEIMFAGVLPDAIATGNHLLLECDHRLVALFRRSFPEVEVIARVGAVKHEFTTHLPTGSLGRLFRTRVADFRKARSPYLVPDDVARLRFQSSYSGPGLCIGLTWHTGNQITGRDRSVDLSLLAPLLDLRNVDLPNLQWISLQYGDHDLLHKELAAHGAPVRIDRSVDQFADIDRFAAQIAAMDLVIAIDNSTAHLAAALGVEVWLLLPFVSDWRWFLERERTLWYPGMKLFRQPVRGDWRPVIEEVRTALQARLSC